MGQSKNHRVVFITAPSLDVAKKLSRILVEERVAACCNIISGITSIYRWDGKICEDPEVMMVVKTRSSLMKKLIKVTLANHPYDVPEIISLNIEEGSPSYMKWLDESVTVAKKPVAKKRSK